MSPEEVRADEKVVMPFGGADVASALAEARAIDPGDFRRRELNWLSQHNPPFHAFVEQSFVYGNLSDEQYKAEPRLFGHLFAHFIVRQATAKNGVAYENIRQNYFLNADSMEKSFMDSSSTRYKGGSSHEVVARELLGEAVVNAVAEVKHLEARNYIYPTLLLLLVRPSILEQY